MKPPWKTMETDQKPWKTMNPMKLPCKTIKHYKQTDRPFKKCSFFVTNTHCIIIYISSLPLPLLSPPCSLAFLVPNPEAQLDAVSQRQSSPPAFHSYFLSNNWFRYTMFIKHTIQRKIAKLGQLWNRFETTLRQLKHLSAWRGVSWPESTRHVGLN